MAELGISYNNRLLFVGKTRTGKTYLANYLLGQFVRKHENLQIVTLDPKHERRNFSKDGESIDFPKLVTRYDKKARFQCFQSYRWSQELEDTVDILLKRGSAIFDLDEVGGIATASSVPDGITRLWTQGGGKGVGAWAKIQFPKRVPGVIKSQSEFFFMFRINPEEDRNDMMNYIPDRKILQKIPKRYYWLYHDDMDEAILVKPLELGKK